MVDKRGKQLLDQAFDELEREVPAFLTKVIEWIRNPKSRWIRLPLGILFIAASFFWFLPVLGIEFLPIGLLLVAQDVPFVRRPAAHLVLWLVHLWMRVRDWYRRKRGRAV